MPKTIEYHPKGIREVYTKPGCRCCWDCKYCVNMADITHYICRARGLTSKRTPKFPYDNTKCKEFELRDDET